MTGILMIENMNRGNTLKQGDLSVLKYRLYDADGDTLNVSGKPATVRLMKKGFTFIAYEKEGLVVSSDDTVSFNINKVLPGGTYYLEVLVDDHIFPSRSDEGAFNVDRSSLGAELNIIEDAGIDAVVRKATGMMKQDEEFIDDMIDNVISDTNVGNIEEYYHQFNEATAEFENLKTQALNSVTRSQNALDVANGIDAKATNALSVSAASDTLSKSVQNQFNQVVIDGDSSVEAAQARVDASGQTNATLKERLDKEYNEVTTQLAQSTVVDVSDYCGSLDTLTDNTQGILQAIEAVKTTSQKKLVFTQGVYAYSSQVVIDNLDEITIEFSPNAKLYDLGKDALTDQGLKKAPVGFRIFNVDNVNIKYLNHDSAVTHETRIVTNISDRVPHIDVDSCKNVHINRGLLESFSGLRIGGGEVYTDSNVMSDFYLRIRKCDNVEVENVELASNTGAGEVFGFYDCNKVKWHDCKHHQVEGERTFWSFGKVIRCDEVEMYGHDVVSSSTGSFIDVIARKIYIHDLHIDYINGKFMDVSNEWRHFNMEMQEVKFVNCSSNGVGIQSTSHGAEYEKIIKKLTVDNCNFAEGIAVNGHFISPRLFETIQVKNCDLKNIRYILESRVSSDITATNKNTTFTNCKISQIDNFNSTEIGVLGKVDFLNCRFDLQNNLRLTDSRLQIDNVETIPELETPSQITFTDCSFKNGRYHSNVNTRYVNCDFDRLHTASQYRMERNVGSEITCENAVGIKSSVPTNFYYPKGFMAKSDRLIEQGLEGSKYFVIGWRKITDDDSNVLNVDWLELRYLTGN